MILRHCTYNLSVFSRQKIESQGLCFYLRLNVWSISKFILSCIEWPDEEVRNIFVKGFSNEE